MANNNYPQITSVTSEALQAQIRNLLPSQEGFGTDLMAQNVIVPIIDLTSAAEGSSVPSYLTRAWDFSTGIAQIDATTATIINNTGFWQVLVNWSGFSGASSEESSLSITDGLSSKKIWALTHDSVTPNETKYNGTVELVVFLAAGESLTGTAGALRYNLNVSYRQIADINGTLVNPIGFNPQ